MLASSIAKPFPQFTPFFIGTGLPTKLGATTWHLAWSDTFFNNFLFLFPWFATLDHVKIARMKRLNIRKLIKQVFRSFIQRDNCLENKFIQQPGPKTFQFNDRISTIFVVILVNSLLNIPEGRLVKDYGHF